MSDNNSGGYPPQDPQGGDYDPTRFGGPPQQQQPPSYGGQQPPSYGGQQPPYSGDQPTTYGGPQQTGPQQGGYPQQPPYGSGPSGPPSYGTPMYGGGGYQPPGGPGYNAPPTGGGGGRNNGLLIGLGALLVALVIGAVALVVVLNRDSDDNTASDDSSETSDPSDEPSEDEPSDEPSEDEPADDEPAEPSEGDVTPTADAIEVEYRFEIGNVCNGQPAKAAKYDPDNPKIDAFRNSVAYPTSWTMAAGGYQEKWYVEYDDFKELSVVGCVTIVEDTSEKGASCVYEDSDGKKTDYDYYGATYELKFYEILTGKKLADGPKFEVDASECPEYGYPVQGKVEGYPAANDVDDAINEFVRDSS